MFISWVIVLLFALGALQAARIAHSRNLPDLYWLAGNFGAAAVGNLFTSLVSVPLLGMVALIISSLCIVMFVQRTFYRDRKSPYLFIIGLLLIVGVVQIYYTITNPTAFMGITQLGFAVVWGWQSFLSFSTGRSIGKDRTVEDWVKARYWLWFAYTFAMFILVVRILLPIPYAAFEFAITSPVLLIAVIVQYITWVMPEPIRLFLNRKYQPVIEKTPAELMAMSEAELLQQIKS